MSFDLDSLVAEAKAVVNEAVSVVDLADKWAGRVSPLLVGLPVVGPEVPAVVAVIAGLDKALHEAQSVLSEL
jgi:hypothetical protein